MADRRKVRGLVVAAMACLAAASWLAGDACAQTATETTFEATMPKGLDASWLVRFDKPLASDKARAMLFEVDREGRPFLVVGNRIVALQDRKAPAAETLALAGVARIDRCGSMSDGTLLAISGRDLGEITGKGFQPILKLPSGGMNVEAASGDLCYLFGGETPEQQGDVYLYRKGGRLARLMHVESPVTAVAGSGEAFTFFATGKGIYLNVPGRSVRLVCSAGEDVTQLALSHPSALFFATSSGVGYAGRPGAAFTFLRGKSARLAARGDALYLFLPSDGVLRISPVALFEKMTEDLAARRSADGKLGDAARLALEAGLADTKAERWTDAIGHFEDARVEAPYHSDVLHNLALALDKAGGRDIPAVIRYRQWLAVAPDAPDAPYARVRIIELTARVEANARRLRMEGMQQADRLTLGSDDGASTGTYVRAQLLSGNIEGARATVQRLWAADDIGRDYGYDQIIDAQIRTGNLPGARATAEQIKSPAIRDRNLVNVACAQAGRLDVVGAKLTLGALKDPAQGFAVAMPIARGWVALGNPDEAEKALREVTDATRRTEYFGMLAGELARAGKYPEALRAAKDSLDALTMQRTYAAVARKQAESGDADSARKSAAMAFTPDAIDPELCWNLSVAWASLADFEGARHMSAKIPWTEFYRSFAETVLVKSLAAKGDLAGARKTVADALAQIQTIEPGFRRDSAVSSLVHAQCAIGDLDGAETTAWLVQDENVRRAMVTVVREARGDWKRADADSWEQLIRRYGNFPDLFAPVLDLRAFLDARKGNAPGRVSNDLMDAAERLEDTIREVNRQETFLQERRARAK